METQKHSGLGIASFICSIVSGVLIFMLFIIAGVIELSTPGGMSEHSASAILIGLFFLFFALGALVALGLGIAGLIQKNRKNIFAILGTVFSLVVLLGSVGVIMLGHAAD